MVLAPVLVLLTQCGFVMTGYLDVLLVNDLVTQTNSVGITVCSQTVFVLVPNLKKSVRPRRWESMGLILIL